MSSILMLGRFLPKLHSIRDSIPDLLATHIHCLEYSGLEPHRLASFFKDKESPIAIIDLSSYCQDVNQLLAKLLQKEFSQLNIVVIHLYEGLVFRALQNRFSRMHFVSIKEINTQLLPLILRLSENK